jgi:hypothetical protein
LPVGLPPEPTEDEVLHLHITTGGFKLKSGHVTNLRCIDDSCEFTLDQVTCLVGKNESGKAAL